LPFINSSTTHP